ncbi:ribbon-helix-helix protein, CopG family [Nocardioides sp. Y6]|uniref:Ribbon-helix-helix protein, CopG family n=1 Tax=Nocardioides malaquae TaxID=2773426 RepID=A0ABR9RS94_9ACTN|nr:ribbon-helix-helix protein, CopG family [Nocardioides malaquae]MBE7324030.1 ribbon-helix-helix protein, CopG family [Nocardioides malaquae]
MSVMERRLQLLLDQQRYALIEREARASGRSVAAVIREAIDVRFADDVTLRQAAARRLLDAHTAPEGVEPDWSEVKADYEAEQAARFESIP